MAFVRKHTKYQIRPVTEGSSALDAGRQGPSHGVLVMWDKEAGLFVPYRRQGRNYRVLRKRLLFCLLLFVVLYLEAVVRSGALVQAGQNLVALQKQEAQLRSDNARLKLQVETLRTPERITDIARSRLHMEVARSNIYLQGR
ncbi:MAG: septum formation initiator family protein [Succiniclasticum sp.]|nr:septum formation initiator family protein [Succiniclasticum sp.]MDY6345569.1 septum formation initiator family protein [Succiniclasticum sp.]